MPLEISNFIIGHLVSLVDGGLVVPISLWALRLYQGGLEEKPKRAEGEPKRIPPSLTGFVERLFFTWIVAFNIPGAATAMIGWLTLKLVTNWNRTGNQDNLAIAKWSAGAFSALVAGLISMSFATIGGLLCRGML